MIKTYNEIADYKEIISYQIETSESKPIYKAYCNSDRCGEDKIEYKLGKEKNVPKSTVFCKDCGSALFWCSNIMAKKYGVESRQNQGREEFRGGSRNAMLSMPRRRRKLQSPHSAA